MLHQVLTEAHFENILLIVQYNNCCITYSSSMFNRRAVLAKEAVFASLEFIVLMDKFQINNGYSNLHVSYPVKCH